MSSPRNHSCADRPSPIGERILAPRGAGLSELARILAGGYRRLLTGKALAVNGTQRAIPGEVGPASGLDVLAPESPHVVQGPGRRTAKARGREAP